MADAGAVGKAVLDDDQGPEAVGRGRAAGEAKAGVEASSGPGAHDPEGLKASTGAQDLEGDEQLDAAHADDLAAEVDAAPAARDVGCDGQANGGGLALAQGVGGEVGRRDAGRVVDDRNGPAGPGAQREGEVTAAVGVHGSGHRRGRLPVELHHDEQHRPGDRAVAGILDRSADQRPAGGQHVDLAGRAVPTPYEAHPHLGGRRGVGAVGHRPGAGGQGIDQPDHRDRRGDSRTGVQHGGLADDSDDQGDYRPSPKTSRCCRASHPCQQGGNEQRAAGAETATRWYAAVRCWAVCAVVAVR